MLASRLPQRRSPPPWTAPAVRTRVLTIDVASARAMFTLTLAARGLLEIINAVGRPWASVVKTLLLAVLAVGFFAAAQRSQNHRGGWLLSGSAAVGLTIASLYDVIAAAIAPTVPASALVVGIVFAAGGAACHGPRH
jgi:hypothetical protein